jgi:hypothetical protein
MGGYLERDDVVGVGFEGGEVADVADSRGVGDIIDLDSIVGDIDWSAELEEIEFSIELIEGDLSVIHIVVRVEGLGGGDCGTSLVVHPVITKSHESITLH